MNVSEQHESVDIMQMILPSVFQLSALRHRCNLFFFSLSSSFLKYVMDAVILKHLIQSYRCTLILLINSQSRSKSLFLMRFLFYSLVWNYEWPFSSELRCNSTKNSAIIKISIEMQLKWFCNTWKYNEDRKWKKIWMQYACECHIWYGIDRLHCIPFHR